MSFNQLQLPGSVLAELYRNTLINFEEEDLENTGRNADTGANPVPLLYLGKNSRNIIVIVDYPLEEYLPPGQLQFLTTMLAACSLTLEDVALINIGRKSPALEELLASLSPRFMLFFGANPPAFKTLNEIPELEIVETAGVSVLSAPSLETLNQNDKESKLLKSRLWANLKRLFKVS